MRDPLDLISLPEAERRRVLHAEAPEMRAKLLGALPCDLIIERGRESVKALGIYETTLTKQERVKGSLLPPQKLKVTVRPEPLALRVEVVGGPGKGRKAVYNRAIDPERIRGREGGVLGFAGAMWLEIRNPLVTRDTNHVITELGLSPLVELVARDFEAMKPAGGHLRPEPPRVDGSLVWLTFATPPGAKGLFGAKTRVGLDSLTGLVLGAEAFDGKDQLLERVRYELLKDRLPLPEAAFRPEAMGL